MRKKKFGKREYKRYGYKKFGYSFISVEEETKELPESKLKSINEHLQKLKG